MSTITADKTDRGMTLKTNATADVPPVTFTVVDGYFHNVDEFGEHGEPRDGEPTHVTLIDDEGDTHTFAVADELTLISKPVTDVHTFRGGVCTKCDTFGDPRDPRVSGECTAARTGVAR